MKNHPLSAIILGLVCLFSGIAVNAQSITKINAKIDFDFHAAGKDFKAGEYIIEKVRPANDMAVYQIRRRDEKAQALFKVIPEQSSYFGTGNDEFILRFNRYGNQYFLSSISNKARAFKGKLPTTKAEYLAAERFGKNKKYELALKLKTAKED